MTKRVVSAEIPERDTDIIVITFSDKSEQKATLYCPENEVVQMEGSLIGFALNSDDWKIIDEELARFSEVELGIKRPKAKSAATRQANRNQRIIDADLTQRKVVGHPDDFPAIRAFAESLYKQRGINLK